MAESRANGGIQSVAIAAKVLKDLASAGGDLPLKALATATGMPRAKVHRYLASLRAAGLIEQDSVSGCYRIGPAAITIGLVGLGRTSPVRQIQNVLPPLRDEIGETVTAAIWGERGPTIVAIEESDHPVTMNVRIGTVLPLLSSAIGRVFLTFLPSSSTQRLVAAERRRPATASPSQQELATLLDGIRGQRLSRAQSALLPGVDAIAAPVLDYRGKLAAVICAVGWSQTMSSALDGPASAALDRTARELSRRLGHTE